jgi:hypothetical protein
MPNRREVLRGGAALPAALAAATLIPEALRAQAFPARTITIVAPFPPGGVADYAARPLAAFLGTKFGKNVVVENRPGAGGGVGHAYVARAEPDGHTIMCSLPSHVPGRQGHQHLCGSLRLRRHQHPHPRRPGRLRCFSAILYNTR